MHLLLTGGGTAGHVMPNIALIECLKKANPTIKISYIGSVNGIENKLLKDLPLTYRSVRAGKFRRYFSLNNFFDLFNILIGMFQSFYYLFRLKPDLVFSKGGYVALPVVVSAYLLRIPVIIHESDSIPGLTTKISSIFAKQVWAKNNFLSKKQSFKFRKVALPVRSELFNGSKTYFTKKFNLSTDNPTLLVMGGSLGAEAINQFVFKNSTTLLKKYNIIHITGRGKASKSLSNPNYLQFDYLDDEMAHAYAAADFILTRAGAGALNEISALNKKAILVPLTKDQSRGEQIINAEIFVKENPAILILQNNLNLDKFESAISRLSKLGKNQGEQASIFDPELILSFFVNK